MVGHKPSPFHAEHFGISYVIFGCTVFANMHVEGQALMLHIYLDIIQDVWKHETWNTVRMEVDVILGVENRRPLLILFFNNNTNSTDYERMRVMCNSHYYS